MNTPSILPLDDDPVSFPSLPTLHGGDPNALGRIDHYDLLRKLGGGGFGVVYLAKDSNSGVEVVFDRIPGWAGRTGCSGCRLGGAGESCQS